MTERSNNSHEMTSMYLFDLTQTTYLHDVMRVQRRRRDSRRRRERNPPSTPATSGPAAARHPRGGERAVLVGVDGELPRDSLVLVHLGMMNEMPILLNPIGCHCCQDPEMHCI